MIELKKQIRKIKNSLKRNLIEINKLEKMIVEKEMENSHGSLFKKENKNA